MDNINKDNLIKFLTYFVIVFILSTILYLMYIDFLTSDKQEIKYKELDVDDKIKNINLIKNKKLEHLTSQIDPLIFDSNAAYILKKDLLAGPNQLAVTNATCKSSDQTITINNRTQCKINANNLHLSSSGINKFSIKVLPDGSATAPDANNFSFYNYAVNITDVSPPEKLSTIRQTYFYFPDNKIKSTYNQVPRMFDYEQIYDKAIINYFDNYARYTNYVNVDNANQLMEDSDDGKLLDTYTSYVNDLLLLTNSTAKSTPFIYKSGYEFDMNDIKTNLINLYNDTFNTASTIQYNMIINDTTNLTCFFDDPLNNMNVYTFELNPSVIITFSNLSLTFSKLDANVTPGTIWSLYYVTALTPTLTPENIFTYNDNIQYPIAIPLATPRALNWENNITNGVVSYFQSIFKHGNLINVQYIDVVNDEYITNNTTPGDQIAITNLTNFLKIIGNTNLSSIDDVFVLYDPSTYMFQSWARTNLIDATTKENIIAPLLYFSTLYSPLDCASGLYFDNKCLPSCPKGFEYDLGLVCLNSNSTMYLPNSEVCNIINTQLSSAPQNSTLSGLLLGCDENYFDNNKVITQADVTPGTKFDLPFTI